MRIAPTPHRAVRGRRFLAVAFVTGLIALLYVPFVNKPVHIDDANFLMLAEGAARDPWRPHSIQINWSGETEPAFDRLANPPGIAWYLSPVRHAPEWVLHLWMLPWLGLAAWGCQRLGREYTESGGFLSAIYLLTCPVIVIAVHALTPDLPLFACMTAGVGGFVTARRRAWPFALLAGTAALFRYSGGTVIPLLCLIGWQRRRWTGAAAGLTAAIPILLLVLHDWHAYGSVHLFAMFSSQNDPQYKPPLIALHNFIAGLAMLGGAGVLPVLSWKRETVVAALFGGGIGLNAAYFSGQSVAQAIPTVLFASAGVAALALAILPHVRETGLSAWAIGGACFFLTVRFAATRYWAAFVPGVGLLALRNVRGRRWLLTAGIASNILISFGMAYDDLEFARSCKQAALQAATHGTGTFSGHWGWQHYLESAGWSAVERDGEPAPLHAYVCVSDPQVPDRSVCTSVLDHFEMPDQWWGPRVHSVYRRASYHAGGFGQYAPWTLSDEPYEVVSIYRRCDAVTGADVGTMADAGAAP